MPSRLSRLAVLAALLGAASASADDAARLFQRFCAPCHGLRGNGAGPAARYLDPKPRDFTTGNYKLKSTASGEPPTDEDLFDTVARGIGGTAMPAWRGHLSDANIRLLVGYIKGLAGEGFFDPPPRPTPINSGPPVATDALLERGRALFNDADKGNCATCHGEKGRGNGPEAANLKDDAGNAQAPSDLSRPWLLKRGGTAAEIFLTLTTGLAGSAMPGYAKTLGEDDRWAVALYAVSLGRSKNVFEALFLDDLYLTQREQPR